jgi:hypothetical protein
VGSGSVIYGADALHWIHLTRGQNSTLPPSSYDRAGITARPRDNELSSASNVTVVADAGHLLSYLHPSAGNK